MNLERDIGGRLHYAICASASVAARSVDHVVVTLIGLCLVLVGACVNHQPDSVIGTWQTGIVQSEWGPHRTTIVYQEDGRVELTVRFLENGSMNTVGTYMVQGDVLTEAIDKGLQEIRFQIDGNTMLQTRKGDQYHFRRVDVEGSDQ